MKRYIFNNNLPALQNTIEEGTDPNTILTDFHDAQGRLRDTSPLCLATMLGHTDMACYLLDAGAEPNMVLECNTFPIIEACKNADTRLVEKLLKAGAKPNPRPKTEYNYTPDKAFDVALDLDSIDERAFHPIFYLLMNAGLDVNSQLKSFYGGKAILTIGANQAKLMELIQYGYQVNSKEPSSMRDRPPLIILALAAKDSTDQNELKSYQRMMMILISKGADAYVTPTDHLYSRIKKNAYELAIELGFQNVANYAKLKKLKTNYDAMDHYSEAEPYCHMNVIKFLSDKDFAFFTTASKSLRTLTGKIENNASNEVSSFGAVGLSVNEFLSSTNQTLMAVSSNPQISTCEPFDQKLLGKQNRSLDNTDKEVKAKKHARTCSLENDMPIANNADDENITEENNFQI